MNNYKPWDEQRALEIIFWWAETELTAEIARAGKDDKWREFCTENYKVVRQMRWDKGIKSLGFANLQVATDE